MTTIDIALTNVDINQCDKSSGGQFQFEIFAGTHRCKNETTQVRRYMRSKTCDKPCNLVSDRIIDNTTKKVLLKDNSFHLNDHTLANQKVGTTLYSIVNSTTGMYCSVAFI